jgi:hypothetical protein
MLQAREIHGRSIVGFVDLGQHVEPAIAHRCLHLYRSARLFGLHQLYVACDGAPRRDKSPYEVKVIHLAMLDDAKLAMSEVRVQHSSDRSDSEIAADIAALRAKLDAARSLPPSSPVTIDVPLEPTEPELVTVHVDPATAGS